MSGILLDTSAVIGCFERRNRTIADIIARSNSAVHVSTLTLGELQVGVVAGNDPARQRSLGAAEAMERVDVDPQFGPACFGFVASRLPRRVGRVDCWIIVAALLRRFELVTQDEAIATHLPRVDWTGSTWREPKLTYIPVSG